MSVNKLSAADLILRLVQNGVISFYEPTGELRFNGILYWAADCKWQNLVAAIGRGKLESALTEATK